MWDHLSGTAEKSWMKVAVAVKSLELSYKGVHSGQSQGALLLNRVYSKISRGIYKKCST